MAKERKQRKNASVVQEETKAGFGNKKLEGPNKPAE